MGLTISGVTAGNKTYDGNTTAALSGTPALVGVVDTEDVTVGGTPSAAFLDANVGTGKVVTVIGYSLTGTAAGNYTLSQPAGLTADINRMAVTITPTAGQSKVFGQSDPLPFTYSSTSLLGTDTISGAVGTFEW